MKVSHRSWTQRGPTERIRSAVWERGDVSIDVTLFIVSAVAILQRPESQWWIAILGLAVAYSPYLVFFAVDISVSPAVEALALGLAWMLAISIWLFGMSAPRLSRSSWNLR